MGAQVPSVFYVPAIRDNLPPGIINQEPLWVMHVAGWKRLSTPQPVIIEPAVEVQVLEPLPPVIEPEPLVAEPQILEPQILEP
jgi:hypothetical protein